jgi:hypothetical protein
MHWGQVFWFFLHSSGYVYKLQYKPQTEEEKAPGVVFTPQNRDFTDEEKYYIEQFFRVWCNYVWCPKCEQPCKDYVESHAPEISTWTNTSALWDFALEFHNHVNAKTNKPTLSSKEAEDQLVTKIRRFVGPMDLTKVSWYYEDYTHTVTMMVMRFQADYENTLQQINRLSALTPSEDDKANNQNLIHMLEEENKQHIARIKVLMKSIAYLLPFQFTRVPEEGVNDTLRDIWLHKISSWDWETLTNPKICLEHLGLLYRSLYPVHVEIKEKWGMYMNREYNHLKLTNELTKLKESKPNNETSETINEAKQETKNETNSTNFTPASFLKTPDHWYIIIFVMFSIQIILVILLCRNSYRHVPSGGTETTFENPNK